MGFHQRHLLSLVSKRMHAKHNAGCCSPPEGGDQQVEEAGVSELGKVTLLGGRRSFALETLQFHMPWSVHNKELCPWGLLWGKERRKEKQQMNSQVGKEGGEGKGISSLVVCRQ